MINKILNWFKPKPTEAIAATGVYKVGELRGINEVGLLYDKHFNDLKFR